MGTSLGYLHGKNIRGRLIDLKIDDENFMLDGLLYL
jgi:hypothetical protein